MNYVNGAGESAEGQKLSCCPSRASTPTLRPHHPTFDLTNSPFSYSYTDLDEYTIIDIGTGSSLSRSLPPQRLRSLYRQTILNSNISSFNRFTRKNQHSKWSDWVPSGSHPARVLRSPQRVNVKSFVL